MCTGAILEQYHDTCGLNAPFGWALDKLRVARKRDGVVIEAPEVYVEYAE